MTKKLEPKPTQEVVGRGDMEIADLNNRIRDLISAPDLTTALDLERLTYARLLTDPGVSESERDGWRGNVIGWAAFADRREDEETGEVSTIPILSLLASNGDVIRLSGWPAITSWAGVVKALGEERCRAGVPACIRRRKSGTVGRAYWVVSIDCVPAPVSNGNIPGI